jgi:hypothetical protein
MEKDPKGIANRSDETGRKAPLFILYHHVASFSTPKTHARTITRLRLPRRAHPPDSIGPLPQLASQLLTGSRMRKTIFQRHGAWLAIPVLACVLGAYPLTARADALAEAANGVNECVQKVETKVAVNPVADVLKLDKAWVEKALLEKNCKVSDLVFIKAIAAKTGTTPEAVLDSAKTDWPAAAKQQGVSPEDLQQQLDDAYADLALKMLDMNGKKKTAKK